VSDTPGGDALTGALLALARWLESQRVPYAVIGGVAVTLQAAPRFTNDIDAVIWVDDNRWAGLVASATPFGIGARRADVLEFATRTRVLLLQHASGVPIDVSCGALPFEHALIERADATEVNGQSIWVARAEDLLVMKAVANRPRDHADIESILVQHPDMDTTAARELIREFADVLESPEILADFDRALRERRKERK
jgi:hypothetical protein